MKKKKSLGIGWSILLLSLTIALVDLIIPAGYQGAPAFLAIMAWNVWLVTCKIIPSVKRRRQLREEKKAAKEEKRAKQEAEDGRPVELVMMLHVNHRITDHIHAIYPNATWAWMEKNPQHLVLHGGIGRIRVNGIEDYEYADVKIEPTGKITCSMVKQMPELRIERKTQSDTANEKQLQNPQIWYEKQGRAVLQNVITDLHSRGHATLTVTDDGSILIQENEEAVTVNRLENFPAKSYWNQLVQVLQRDGLAAKIEAKGLQLTW